jgi:D-alanyl-D-alanine carboxypeptidase (penicillin-binding protein 5/6)
MQLIAVVLNCGPMWDVSMKYMDIMFDKYHLHTFLEPFTYWGEIPVSNKKDKKVGIYTRDLFEYPVCGEEEKTVSNRLELPGTVKAPVKKDAEIGKIKFYLDNELIFSSKVFTINSIESPGFFEAAEKIIRNM